MQPFYGLTNKKRPEKEYFSGLSYYETECSVLSIKALDQLLQEPYQLHCLRT